MTIRFQHRRSIAAAAAPALAALVLAAGCGGSTSVSRSGASASASGSAGSTGAAGTADGSISRGLVNRVEQAVASRIVRDVHVSGSTLVVDVELPSGSLTQSIAGAACGQVKGSGVLSAGSSLGIDHISIVSSDHRQLASC